MWFIFNSILKSFNVSKIIGLSATISKDVVNSLFNSSRFKVEYKEEPFVFNSVLEMLIFDKPFEYEKRFNHLDYVAEKIKQIITDKGVVILATSYEDVKYLYEKLIDNFSIVRQREGENASDILDKYEKAEADILIGNKAFWEGVNIKRDSDFVIVKMPYYSPYDVDFTAIEEYSKKNSYPLNRKEALITLTQGLGRIIRDNNQTKRVFIFDNRIKDFVEVIDELPVALKVAIIDEKVELGKEEEKIIFDDDFIRFAYFNTYKQLQKALLKKEKIEQKEFREIYMKLKKKDQEIRERLGLKEIGKRRNQIYGKLYERIVKDFIELYAKMGIEINTKQIAEKTGLTQVYVNEIKQKEN